MRLLWRSWYDIMATGVECTVFALPTAAKVWLQLVEPVSNLVLLATTILTFLRQIALQKTREQIEGLNTLLRIHARLHCVFI